VISVLFAFAGRNLGRSSKLAIKSPCSPQPALGVLVADEAGNEFVEVAGVTALVIGMFEVCILVVVLDEDGDEALARPLLAVSDVLSDAELTEVRLIDAELADTGLADAELDVPDVVVASVVLERLDVAKVEESVLVKVIEGVRPVSEGREVKLF